MSSELNQVITFKLQESFYGLQVGFVQEVTRATNIAPIPLAEESLIGLLNLRGQITLVVSLSTLLGLSRAEEVARPDGFNLVICRVPSGLLALCVDEIGDVISFDEADIEPSPLIESEDRRKYVSGLLRSSSQPPLILLNFEKISESIQYNSELERENTL